MNQQVNMQVGIVEAAKILGFKSAYSLAWYIDNNRGPDYEEVAGRKVFHVDTLRTWKKTLKRKTRKEPQ